MSGFPLSLLTDQIINISPDSENITELKEANTKALLDMLKGLSNGETFVAKVISSDENGYVIQTENNVTINARSHEGVSLTPGRNVIFEVNKFSNDTFSLRPLNTNVNSENTAMSALKEAGIPINSRTIEMTERLMEYQSPIDRNSLAEAFRDVSLNPSTPVKYIVDLQKMSIPVSRENLLSYEACLNMKNSVAEGLMEVSHALTDAMFLGTTLDSSPVELLNQAVDFLDSMKEKVPDSGLGKLFEDISKEIKTEYANSASDEEVNTLAEEDGKNRFVRSLSDFDKEILPAKNTETHPFDKQKITNIFTKAFIEHVSLNEEEISSKTAIKELYRKIISETGDLTRALEETVSKESPAFAPISNITANLDFMNALNGFIPYIQIPFTSEGSFKAGELYVFRDPKRSLSANGELSAFLHLDTENLGATDVYIRMISSKVTTSFCLEDEESLRFIEDNMKYLNARMNEKGYDLSFSAKLMEKKKTPIETVLEQSVSKMMIGMTSFDARV